MSSYNVTVGPKTLFLHNQESGSIEETPDRIIACVKACEGIADPSVVPDLLNIARSYRALAVVEGEHEVLKAVDAVIARVEGRK
jgi:hypothetical protein